MSKGKRVFALFLTIALFISSFQVYLTKSYAAPNATYAVSQQSIQEKEQAIEAAKEEKQKLQNGLTNVQTVISDLESSKDSLESYVSQLDASVAEIESNIAELEAQIVDKQLEIERTQAELEAAQAVQDAQYEAMKERIKFIYESQSDVLWEVLLYSGSFSELLNKADYIEQLSAYDRQMLMEYQNTCMEISLCEEQLELEEEILELSQEELENEKEAINTLISEKEKEIVAYENDISNREKLVAEYKQEIAAQEAEIAALEKAVAEEKARLAAEQALARTYDGGTFQWPCPSYTRVSDDYGVRIHPTLMVEQFHNGVDLAAPYGSAILAAYDGEVISASYSSTMGNYIMIDHGDNLYTIYMHASALYVSTGATVKRGDKIAAVGSTGRSTGNHLHFSVRLNGSYVSPWNYILKP